MRITDREAAARLIKAAAASQGLPLAGLADRLGVSRQSLSRTINRAALTVPDLLRIADALALDLVIEFRER